MSHSTQISSRLVSTVAFRMPHSCLSPSRFFLAAVLLGLIAAVTSTLSQAADHPNILWVVSEDNTFNYVGAYGDPLARTPNIDRLARSGIVYENAHSTSPVCAPARSSIITGMYAASLGTQHMRSEQPLPPEVRFFPEYLRAAGYYCTNNDKTDYNTSTLYEKVWDDSSKQAHWRNRAPGQPFFAVFNFMESHESALHARVPLVTDPASVRVPAYLPDTPDVRADIAQYYDSVSRADEKIGEILRQLDADGLADDTIVFYYSDNGGVLPRSKRFLYDNGTHIAMVAHYPKKYQALAPTTPGGRNVEMVNFVDLAPTVLSLAGLPLPSYLQGRALAGSGRGPAPEYTMVTRDRMDERPDLMRALSDGRYRYIRNFRPDLPNGRKLGYLWQEASMRDWARLSAAGKLDATQRTFFEPKPAEQLFDCRTDPDNIRNLASEPAQRARLEKFRVELHARMLAIRDTGLMSESLMAEMAAGGSPALVARSEARYPLKSLLETVDALQLGAPSEQDIESALNHPLPVFRYWGVIGAMNSGRSGKLDRMLADSNRTVRLTAAEAIIRNDAPASDSAWREIVAALDPANSAPLRIAAANVVADCAVTAPAGAVAALAKIPELKEKFFMGYFSLLLKDAEEARVVARGAR